MQSFRSEIENPIVEKDIIELEKKIALFNAGKVDEEKFKSMRLARGVYGQRQSGVQMIRIKIPYGRLSTKQLLRISEVSDTYSNGNLHATTRQDIQIHYVSLDDTPQLWAELEKDKITLREACGNTVRNVTASPTAGIDPKEPFDVSPYAETFFSYFLRNPICQELGRKIKVAFSSSDDDDAYTFIHDLGFIPKTREVGGQIQRGFKVVIAGGLGAQPLLAQAYTDFLPEDEVIPFSEALLRVFDRHGERSNRNKARMKYLVKKIGLEALLELVQKEKASLKNQTFSIDTNAYVVSEGKEFVAASEEKADDSNKYNRWFLSNLFTQKQQGYYAIKIKISTGDFSTATARKLVEIVNQYAADDIRITANQGLLLKFIHEDHLPAVFNALDRIGLAEPGANSTADITTCPGTETCNLGISSSMGITRELEKIMKEEYPELVYNNDIKIKISGCMNSCAQHSLAHIGFHGSTIKSGELVAPALQVLLGGGPLGNGEGRAADKIIKIPSKRGGRVLRAILNDYESEGHEGEYFNDYYLRQGKKYFYDLLKEINQSNLLSDEFIDWGYTKKFETAIGIGECAGVTIDLVATLLHEASEKIENAKETLKNESYADSIYHSYSAFIHAAKALLMVKDVPTNTQVGIIKDFDLHFVGNGDFPLASSFSELIFQIKNNEPTADFAKSYFEEANTFVKMVYENRENQLRYDATTK